MDPPIIVALSREECAALLATAVVGRVGLSMGALPVVLPVNFAVLDDEDIVFRTAEGTKFHAAAAGAVVAFEADGYEPSGRGGWSVLVQGVAQVVSDAIELAQLSALAIDPWAVDGSADRFVRIRAERVTGRRFSR